MPRPIPSAFSLVELSIVLVILGLLTGGILAGQSLIRAAELRSVSAEYARYVTTFQAFRDKYFALPGDMTNATAFWGKDAAACNGHTGTAGTPGTCNGNGNGITEAAAGASLTGETFQLWKQLALAGLIEGSYTGLAGPSVTGWVGNHAVLGTNAPRSRMGGMGWGLAPLGNYGGDPSLYVMDYGNALAFGAQSDNAPIGIALKPEEAWNIDTKIDDGRPGYGQLVPRDTSGFGTAGSCTTSANSAARTGDYKLTNNALACSLMFIKAV